MMMMISLCAPKTLRVFNVVYNKKYTTALDKNDCLCFS